MIYQIKIFFQILFLLTALTSCKSNYNDRKTKAKIAKVTQPVSTPIKGENKEILVQPFSDLSPNRTQYFFQKLVAIYSNTHLLTAIELPSNAYYQPRNRYKADTIIQWLDKRVKNNQIIVGITSKDISTAKNGSSDWGIMGLGRHPGSSCVITTFRPAHATNEQSFKVIIHELGHTFGLPHCPVKTCFMRDAEGHNTTGEEKEFCSSCKGKLIRAGWRL